MKNIILASILFALVPAALVASCTTEDSPTLGASSEEMKVNCDGDSARPWCSVCGNGGKVDCCWKSPDGCDVLCSGWIYRKDDTRWCP